MLVSCIFMLIIVQTVILGYASLSDPGGILVQALFVSILNYASSLLGGIHKFHLKRLQHLHHSVRKDYIKIVVLKLDNKYYLATG